MNGANAAGAKPLSRFLRMAVMAGVESAVRIHIDRGDDINARDASGMTPLMLSAARNKPAICKLLLGAGADHGLLDPSGRTALEIAIAARSEAAAAILATIPALAPAIPKAVVPVASGPERAADCPLQHESVAHVATTTASDAAATSAETGTLVQPPDQEASPPAKAMVDMMDDGEFDLAGWETEDEPTRPEADSSVVESATAVQMAITAHQAIDSSVEWDDIDAYLPDLALPLARADDAEGRANLRRLLLRALREGSVPALDVRAQSTNEDRSANREAEAYLTMVINDLGAEVDERFEYATGDDNFKVFVDPKETPEEEATLDEALVAIDRAASPRHQPLQMYQREFQRLRLLDAEGEIRLAKNMEAALDAALDALATWPDGIARTLAAGAEAIAGSRPLSSIWVGGDTDPEPTSSESLELETAYQAQREDAADDDGEPQQEALLAAGDDTFADALRRLAALIGSAEHPEHSPDAVRHALLGLRLNRCFLLELIDAANGPAPCPEFARAMADFRKARDWMTTANLKLAFFYAKKHLYSGAPLDDLAQEGNIGLIKAVDRFDWRRGFRFSTYATWWIRQQIGKYVADKVRTIRVPLHVYEKLQRVERMAQTFEAAVGRKPALDELAERVEMPRQRLAALLRIAPEPSTLDEQTVDSMIAIETRDAYASADPTDVVDEVQLHRAVDRYISSLSTKDRKEESILRLRFGIGVHEGLTLEEIGNLFQVTRERIRQIEAKALKKLRNPARSEPFARMVLGLEPEQNPLAPSARENLADDRRCTTEVLPPAGPMQAAPPHPPRANSPGRLIEAESAGFGSCAASGSQRPN